MYTPGYAGDVPPEPVVVERPPSVIVEATDDAFHNGLWAGRLEAVTLVAGAAYFHGYMREDRRDDEDDWGIDYNAELRDTRTLMRELEMEVAADPLVAAIERPADGTYLGETAEDDAGDQSASTTLSFDTQGLVTGTGVDGVDGAYKVDGRWSGTRVVWIEKYDEGFTVALRGQVLPDGSIRAMWASSRGIGGAVTLDAPLR